VLPPAELVKTRVDGQSSEPAVEGGRIAQSGQITPRPDERILDGVPREVVVPDDEPGRRVQARDGRAGERGKGVVIALLRSLDESSLVHGRP
jgi:hypothetical protein